MASIDTLQLPVHSTAARQGRLWLAERIATLDLSEKLRHDIALATHELVQNVVDHTDSAPLLTLQLDAHSLRVGVTDHSASRVATRDVDGTGGWGLRIVDEIADDWGATYRDGGKTVWFAVVF